MIENTPSANPWVNIWVRPRQTMRAILNTNPRRWIILLALLSGLVSTLVLWLEYPQRQDYHQPIFIIALLVFGSLVGLLHLYFASWLLRLTGSWIGGKGTFTEVKSAVGWGYYPFIVVGILNILALLLFKYPVLYFVMIMIYLAVAIWAMIIYFKLLGEAHQFSAWRALAAALIMSALVFATVIIIFILIPLISPLFVAEKNA